MARAAGAACALLLLAAAPGFCDAAPPPYVNAVLLGATGDLSSKYLWSAFFKLFRERNSARSDSSKPRLRVFGGARKPRAVGSATCRGLAEAIPCPESDYDCIHARHSFSAMAAHNYVQLKTEQDWTSFCRTLNASSRGEAGRIFYLAVPPFAYQDISQNIQKHCRPPKKGSWLRAVFEKPFGSDTDSARSLAEKIARTFREEEVYRIDHYLGKPVVRDMLRLRESSPAFEKLLNGNTVERVDIVMREKIGCEGRGGYYNKYGVIRDVLQNHLTEIAALIAADLPQNGESWRDKKLEFLQKLKFASPGLVQGRYKEYSKHVIEDGGNPKAYMASTFAAVSLLVDTERWRGVPFVLSSGKRTGEREAYIHLTLRPERGAEAETGEPDDDSCGSAPAPAFSGQGGPKYYENVASECRRRWMHVHIQGSGGGAPGVFVSPGLEFDTPLSDWTRVQGARGFVKEGATTGAYDFLVKAVVEGDRSYFLSTAGLLASWRVWDPVITASENSPQIKYTPADFKNVAIGIQEDGALQIDSYSRGSEPIPPPVRGDGFWGHFEAKTIQSGETLVAKPSLTGSHQTSSQGVEVEEVGLIEKQTASDSEDLQSSYEDAALAGEENDSSDKADTEVGREVSIEEQSADVVQDVQESQESVSEESNSDILDNNAGADNAETDNAETIDAETDNTETDNTETDNAETDNAESDNAETDNAETDNAETVNTDNTETDSSQDEPDNGIENKSEEDMDFELQLQDSPDQENTIPAQDDAAEAVETAEGNEQAADLESETVSSETAVEADSADSNEEDVGNNEDQNTLAASSSDVVEPTGDVVEPTGGDEDRAEREGDADGEEENVAIGSDNIDDDETGHDDL